MTNEEYRERWPELWAHRVAASRSLPPNELSAAGLEELVDLSVGDMNPAVRAITPGAILDAVLTNLQGFAARGVFSLPSEVTMDSVLNWKRLAERAQAERGPASDDDDDFLGFGERGEPQAMTLEGLEALIPMAIKNIDCIGLDVTAEAIRDEVIDLIEEVVAHSEFVAPSQADLDLALDLGRLSAHADRHHLVESAPASPGMH